MDQTWLGKAEARGFEKGKAEAVEQMRQMVLGRIEKRFGSVPDSVQAKVRTIGSMEALVKLLEKLPILQSVEDLLPRRNGRPKSVV